MGLNVYGTEGPVISDRDYLVYEQMIAEGYAAKRWDDPWNWENCESLRLNRLANKFFAEHAFPPPKGKHGR